MKSSLILGTVAALVAVAPAAAAKSPAEIEQIAKAVSVEIQVVGVNRVGSGSIIHRQGNLYTLITNRHVACGNPQKTGNPNVLKFCTLPQQQAYALTTADGQKYRVTVESVKLIGRDLDLATMQFRSSRSYPVAKVADHDSLKVDDAVYTAGFPKGQGWLFGSGKARAVVNKRLLGDRGGYTVVYDSETLPGMSGGGAFDKNGLLVAIHGLGDRYQENTEDIESNFTGQSEVGSKIGLNRGVPIRWVLESIKAKNIQRSPINPQISTNKADEHFIIGFNKWIDPGSDKRVGRKEAVQAFSQAIRLNPRYKMAYYMRAYVSEQIEQYDQALDDLNKFILLDPKSASAYHLRGRLKHLRLNDNNGAIADFEKAISINPAYSYGWYSRGFRMEYQLHNPLQKAYRLYDSIEDCNRAITIDAQNFNAYLDRGILKFTKRNDRIGAIADIRTVIRIAKEQNNSYVLKIALRAIELMGGS